MSSPSTLGRMYHIDFMRVVTFSCVVAVHTTGTVLLPGRLSMSGFSLLMHFTRYAFIFITAFVLFHGYYRRDVVARTFWRKRFGLVVLPYLVWSLIYCGLTWVNNPWPGGVAVLHDTVVRILTGQGWFHLYFLMVSMQFYFLFPLLRWIVRRTQGHHVLLLAAAWVVQLGCMVAVSYLPRPGNILGQLWDHSWITLPMYSGFMMCGALWAVHYRRVHEFVVANRRPLWAVVALGSAVTIGVYLLRVKAYGLAPGFASSAMHPDVVPWALAAILGLYLVGWAWARRRGDGDGLVGRVVDAGSVRAFGVFAIHPLVLWIFGQTGSIEWLLVQSSHILLRVPLLVAATIAGSLLLTEVFLRSPASRLLAARNRLPLPARHLPVNA